jgi:uncharacterized protein YceK
MPLKSLMQLTGVRAQTRCLTASCVMLAAVALSGCSSFRMPYIPWIHPAPPDLTPARDSADNMVRLDAALRSGCDSVLYIDKPAPNAGTATSTAPQRWVAHTCRGELSYDVLTEKTPQGPVVKVVAVAAPIDKPMNPHMIPAEHGE